MALTLEQAERIVQGARRKAVELGVAITVAVVDDGGHLVALSRMDGARFITVDVALGKAFTAAAFQRESAQVGQNPFLAAGPELSGGRIVPLGGGLPVRLGNQVVGGVGASGATADQDAECAKAGLAQL